MSTGNKLFLKEKDNAPFPPQTCAHHILLKQEGAEMSLTSAVQKIIFYKWYAYQHIHTRTAYI